MSKNGVWKFLLLYILVNAQSVILSHCGFLELLWWLFRLVIQAYAPTSNAEEAEVERFYEDLQDLLQQTPKKMSFSL